MCDMGKVRLSYIDVAKGLAIIMIVYQHVLTYFDGYNQMEQYMQGFRIPLFFILSGCFFKTYSDASEYTKRKINTLLVPFVFFYLLFTVLMPNVLYAIGYQGLRQVDSLGWSSLLNFWVGRGYSNNPVWFLLALFWVSMLFYVFKKLSERCRCSYLCLGLLSVIAGLCGVACGHVGIRECMNMDCALTAMPYYYFGYVMKTKTDVMENMPSRWLCLISALLCFVVVYLISPGCDYLANMYSWKVVPALYVTGIVGTIGVVLVANILQKSSLLKFYGKNTLTILCMQMPVIQLVHMIPSKIGFGGG